MKDKIIILFKQTSIYSLGSFFNQAAAFFLIPLYTAYLLPDEYGILQLCRVFTSILMILLLMGMSSSMFRVYYNTGDVKERILIKNTTLSFYIFAAVIFFGIYLVIKFLFINFPTLLLGVEKSNLILLYIIVTVILEGFFSLELAVLRAEEKPVLYSVATFLRLMIYILVCVYLIVFVKSKYIGILQAGIYSFLGGIFFLSPFVLRHFRFVISKQLLVEILQVGVPLAIGGLGIWILNLSDRYMLKYLLPGQMALFQIGIYALGDKISSVISFILVTPIMLSWGVLMFKFSKLENAGQIFRAAFNIFGILFGSGVILLSIFGKEIVSIISSSQQYLDSYKVIPFLSLSKALYGLTVVISAGIIITKKSKFVALSNFIAALLNIILNIIFIPRLGYIGAAMASSLAFLLNFFILYHQAQKYYYFPYNLSIIMVSFIVIALLVAVALHYDLEAPFKMLLILVYIASLYILGLLKPGQIRTFIRMIMMKIGK